MTLGHQFSRQLPENINSTFVDLVPQIRRLGSDSFIQQLLKQKALLSEFLSAAKGNCYSSNGMNNFLTYIVYISSHVTVIKKFGVTIFVKNVFVFKVVQLLL